MTCTTGHLCQTYEWAEHGEDIALRSQALHVGVLDGDRLVGAVLLLKSPVGRLPGALFYAPRGPVVEEPDGPVLPMLMQAAAQFARKAGGIGIRVEPNMPNNDERWVKAFTQLGYKANDNVIYLRNTWILDLYSTEEQLLADMKMTWRYNIGYAARKGVTVRPARDEADFETFIRLLSATSVRDHFYMYPKNVFHDMLDHYSAEIAARDATARITLLLAEHNGEALGATTVATFGEWAWSMHTGLSDEKAHRKLRPNYVLQWEAIKHARSLGVTHFDFRNIPEILEPGQEMYGVYEFKRGFGGYFHRVGPTMDYVLNPLVYLPYSFAVNLRRARQKRRHAATAPAAPTTEAAHEEQATIAE